MELEFEAVTDVGRLRTANEDSYAVLPKLGLFAVADGMGGQAAGEVASRTALDCIVEFIRQSAEQADITWPVPYDPSLSLNENRLRAAVALANMGIRRAAEEDAGLAGMGTTVVCALDGGDRVVLAHVGDSRAYLLRGGALERLTRDHSWVGEQIDRGLLSEDQARDHPLRNVVTRALGVGAEVDAELSSFELRSGEVLLLCSDGLTSMVPDAQVRGILERCGHELSVCVKALVSEANRQGGHDNITVVLLRRPSPQIAQGLAGNAIK